jgi:hypothetical protein
MSEGDYYPVSTVYVQDNIISENQSISEKNDGYAGGLNSSGSKIILINNNVTNNVVSGYTKTFGSGAHFGLLPSGSKIEKNVIKDNKSLHGQNMGGGIYLTSSIATLANNIISGHLSSKGGGLYIKKDKVILINNTIIDNTAGSGGTMYIEGATTYVMNSILRNHPTSSADVISNVGGDIKIAYSNVQNIEISNGNIDEDPLIVSDTLSNNSLCIGAGIMSYAFDAGTECVCPSNDINNRSRPYPKETNPDMGASESIKRVPTAIQGEIPEIPTKFALSQNYPNPFNPVTSIEYQVPSISDVELSIYNILGQKMATLVNKKQPAGSYQIEWDASSYSSGIYLYILKTSSGFHETKKLVLLR